MRSWYSISKESRLYRSAIRREHCVRPCECEGHIVGPDRDTTAHNIQLTHCKEKHLQPGEVIEAAGEVIEAAR